MEQIIIEEINFEKARKKIKENQNKKIVFSGDDNINRKILEKEKINVLLLEQNEKKDFQKQRNSGFNQVLARLAKKKDVIIGIDLDELIESKKKEKSKIIARIIQNVKLCKKEGVKMEFISLKYKKSKFDLKSLSQTLGMSNDMIIN